MADVTASGGVVPVKRELITTRLGQGMSAVGLAREAMDRTVEAVLRLVRQSAQYNVLSLSIAGTSAVRDALNGGELADSIMSATGLPLRVLLGPEEARYSYEGVASSLFCPGDVLVMDVGGGSTEFTWQQEGKLCCFSVNVGAVRMTEGGHSDAEIYNIMRPVMDEFSNRPAIKAVGVGGTVTTLAAMDLNMAQYSPELVHGHVLTLGAVQELHRQLVSAGPRGRLSLPGLQPSRADIIVAGVRIVLLALSGLGSGAIIASEADLLYGLALEAGKLEY